MTAPKLLDLFCKAGGATRGYQEAGFHVTGVDIEAQPRYCGDDFYQADALAFPLDDFDVIHASPPCQGFSDMRVMWNARQHEDLLTPTRHRLIASGLPYVIENVEGAPLPEAICLCGSMFSLGVDGYQLRRHRLFEVSTGLLLVPACQHRCPVIGVYGDHARNRGRRSATGDRGTQFPNGDMQRLASMAMGIDWMNWRELSQAIPPAYTRWIGERLLAVLQSGQVAS